MDVAVEKYFDEIVNDTLALLDIQYVEEWGG
jgi:hypothetical protein